MLQSDVFSACNWEWLNWQTLEKTTEFCGPSIKVLIFESRLTLNGARHLANWDITPWPSLQSYPRKNKEPTLRIFWIQLCLCVYPQNETNWGNLLKVKSSKWHLPKTCWEMVWETNYQCNCLNSLGCFYKETQLHRI